MYFLEMFSSQGCKDVGSLLLSNIYLELHHGVFNPLIVHSILFYHIGAIATTPVCCSSLWRNPKQKNYLLQICRNIKIPDPVASPGIPS